MTSCFSILPLLALGVFAMVTLIRFFEQVTEAVDRGWWNKVATLIGCPFAVWFYPSPYAAGRAAPVPHYEPVRGFSGGTKISVAEPTETQEASPPRPAADGPPPGTPKEFIGMPVIPPKKPGAAKPGIDPDKLAKLKAKMRDQGMLPPE